MRILFDSGVPKGLRDYLTPHQVVRSQQLGWAAFSNGELLGRAQADFAALITTDSNLQYQQNIHDYDLIVIVLRAFKISLQNYLTLIPEIMERIEQGEPGCWYYVYEDERLRERDAVRGILH